MPTQIAQDVPADTGAWKQGTALATAAAVFVSVSSIYLLLRPPLYNYDGYLDRLQALEPVQSVNLNPHHLLWYPIRKGHCRGDLGPRIAFA